MAIGWPSNYAGNSGALSRDAFLLFFLRSGVRAMRSFLVSGLLSVVVGTVVGDFLRAEETVVGVPVARVAPTQVLTVELIQAHQEYQLAKLRRHEYRFVTLPRHRRQLDDQVRLAEAEIAVLQRRLRDYRPFLRVGHYSPVRTFAESHSLALISAEQRLQQLKDERLGLFRLTRQHNQLYQLDVLQAATRLALARQAVE